VPVGVSSPTIVEPLPNPNPPKDFAHPIEAEFARLLDFYLPPFDLYVELTTRRQPTITRKHHKIRRLNELYPTIELRLLNRRQMRSLLFKYGLQDGLPRLTGATNA
jgi:hypothetical protein